MQRSRFLHPLTALCLLVFSAPILAYSARNQGEGDEKTRKIPVVQFQDLADRMVGLNYFWVPEYDPKSDAEIPWIGQRFCEPRKLDQFASWYDEKVAAREELISNAQSALEAGYLEVKLSFYDAFRKRVRKLDVETSKVAYLVHHDVISESSEFGKAYDHATALELQLATYRVFLEWLAKDFSYPGYDAASFFLQEKAHFLRTSPWKDRRSETEWLIARRDYLRTKVAEQSWLITERNPSKLKEMGVVTNEDVASTSDLEMIKSRSSALMKVFWASIYRTNYQFYVDLERYWHEGLKSDPTFFFVAFDPIFSDESSGSEFFLSNITKEEIDQGYSLRFNCGDCYERYKATVKPLLDSDPLQSK